jgi:N-acyl-D-amino-acid deacylase
MTTLLISGGTLVDGTGAAGYPGWVAVEGSTISAVGAADAPAPAADRVVDATGRVVTPGFIDVHSHSDFVVVALPELTSSVAQGITTMVVGNCGSSPAPLAERTRFADLVAQLTGEVLPDLPEVSWQSFGEFLDAVEAARPAVNVAALVGFGALRAAVVADPTRPADADEVARMRRLLSACLDEGAIGLSTGLIYDPDRSASREEIVEVARELRGRGRYASHIRGEGADLWAAVSEAVGLAREVGVPVQVSHLKLEGSSVWGQADRLLGVLAARRAEGLLVEGDQYPYAAYETSLSAFFPAWAIAGDLPELLAGPRCTASAHRRRAG